MHIPRPWYRKSKKAYYAQIGKRQHRLGKTREEAQQKFKELILHDGQGTAAAQVSYKVNEVCDLFLDWSLQHNQRETYEWYRSFLQNFCDQCGKRGLALAVPNDHCVTHVRLSG